MKTADKYKRLLKDTFIFALGNLGSKLILFFLVPLYTNFLSTEEYGIADLVFTISQFLVPVFSVVIFDAVIRFGLSKHENAEEVLLNGLIVWFAGTIGIVIVTPLFGFYRAVADWKWYLCLYSSVSILYSILMNYLKTIDRNRTYAAISIIQTLLLAGLNILLLIVFHIGVKGYLLSNILALFASSVIILMATGALKKIATRKINKQLLREMVIYSAPLIFNNLSWWIIHSSDKIMIEWMIGAAALGIYTVATKIPALINVIISIFSQAWGLSAVREFESSNDGKYYSDVLKHYSFLVYFVCIITISIIKPFMSVYVSAEFSDSWHYVPLLLASAVFSAIAAFYGTFYSALKKTVNNMITTLSGALINIIVNYIFIRLTGIWGAAIGTATAYIVIAVVRVFDIGRMIDIKVNIVKTIANSLIIIIHAVLVSLNILTGMASLLAITLFFVINRDEAAFAIAKTKSLLKRGKT